MFRVARHVVGQQRSTQWDERDERGTREGVGGRGEGVRKRGGEEGVGGGKGKGGGCWSGQDRGSEQGSFEVPRRVFCLGSSSDF